MFCLVRQVAAPGAKSAFFDCILFNLKLLRVAPDASTTEYLWDIGVGSKLPDDPVVQPPASKYRRENH